MQTYTPVVSVVYVILAAIAVVAIDLRIVLVPAACASLLLAVAGLLIFRRLRGALIIPWPAAPDHTEQQGCAVIEGTPLAFQGYDQELIIGLHSRHVLELLACGLLAVATLYITMFSNVLPANPDGLQIGGFEAEIICAAGLLILLLNLRWFAERRMLRRSHYTVGMILSRDPGMFFRGVTYQFHDASNERRGGRGPLRQWNRDNAVLVLYDPKDPDTNATQQSFLFHHFSIALIPARNRRPAEQVSEVR